MRARLIGKMVGRLVPRPVRRFHAEVMQRKHDDHHASHNNRTHHTLYAILEPPCHDAGKLLLGDNTRNTTLIFLGYLALPVVEFARAGSVSGATSIAALPTSAAQWWAWTWIVVLGRVAYLLVRHGVWASMRWYVKLVTDPATDIGTYFPWWPQRA